MRWRLNPFGSQIERLKSASFEINKLLHDIHYQAIEEFEISPLLSGVFDKLESVPEWWKEHYKLSAMDPQWLGLTEEAAYEDFVRYSSRVLLQVLKDRYGYRGIKHASIMDMSDEDLAKEIKNVQNWIAEDNDVLKEAIEKVGSDKDKLEIEIFGKKLTDEEKEDMVRNRMLEVIRREFGSENNESEIIA